MLSRRLLSALLLLGLAVTATPVPRADAADEIHARWRDFAPSGTYVLVRNGRTQQDAAILHSRRAAAFLVLDSGYGAALLLEPRASRVSKVPAGQIKRREDGYADLLANAEVTSLGTFQRRRRDIQIRLGEFSADLKPNPPLLAWKLCTDLTQHSPEYAKDAKEFRLDEDALRALRTFEGKARINVYFGSWCGTCSRYLGRIIRLEQALSEQGITFYYYGLPRVPAMWRDPEVRRHRIRKLPSGVVYANGRRVGMIASTQWNKPAIELAKYLIR